MALICSMCHTNAFIFTIKLICQTLLKAFLHVVLPTNWSACMVSACFSFVYCIHVKRSTWPTFNELCLKFWIENSPSLLVCLLFFLLILYMYVKRPNALVEKSTMKPYTCQTQMNSNEKIIYIHTHIIICCWKIATSDEQKHRFNSNQISNRMWSLMRALCMHCHCIRICWILWINLGWQTFCYFFKNFFSIRSTYS